MRKELVYLGDGWKLAKKVEEQLSRDQFDAALTLVRLASKDMSAEICVEPPHPLPAGAPKVPRSHQILQ